MDERYREKIKEIQNFLEELHDMLPFSLEEYCSNLKTKAACERYFEKIVNDIPQLFIKTSTKNCLK